MCGYQWFIARDVADLAFIPTQSFFAQNGLSSIQEDTVYECMSLEEWMMPKYILTHAVNR